MIPNTGLLKIVRRFAKFGSFASGFTAALIESIPNIKIANPKRMDARFFLLSLFANIIRIMPIKAKTAEKDVGLSSCINTLSPSIPERLKIHAVTVVPTLAPIIIPIACLSFIIPEFTKPTTITVVADDDCITAVTAAPSKNPLKVLLVIFSRVFSSLPPENFSRPSPIVFIPYKKSAKPPNS